MFAFENSLNERHLHTTHRCSSQADL